MMRLLKDVGNTPLRRIHELNGLPDGVEIYAKLEWMNPGGSVKDRAALWMILDGLSSGSLDHDKTILDSTSGNTGIAYALLGSVLGFEVELVIPKNVSQERMETLERYGAKVICSNPCEGSDGAIRETHRRYRLNPEKYFMPDQYNNPFNMKAHYETTGPEIIEQTGGNVTHIVAGVGTGGTIMGAGRRLKEHDQEVEVIGVGPVSAFHGIEGLKHLESSIIPEIFDPAFLDDYIKVETDESYTMASRLALEEGLFVGQSSGAAMLGALDVANDIDEGLIVVIFPDSGYRYLSTSFWDAGVLKTFGFEEQGLGVYE